jgi:hypothetical protein
LAVKGSYVRLVGWLIVFAALFALGFSVRAMGSASEATAIDLLCGRCSTPHDPRGLRVVGETLIVLPGSAVASVPMCTAGGESESSRTAGPAASL